MHHTSVSDYVSSSHGFDEIYSYRGIALAVQYLWNKGHGNLIVCVPEKMKTHEDLLFHGKCCKIVGSSLSSNSQTDSFYASLASVICDSDHSFFVLVGNIQANVFSLLTPLTRTTLSQAGSRLSMT